MLVEGGARVITLSLSSGSERVIVAFAPRVGLSVLDRASPGLSDVVEDEEPRDPGRPARHFGVEHQRPESTATCAVRRPVPEFGDASAI